MRKLFTIIFLFVACGLHAQFVPQKQILGLTQSDTAQFKGLRLIGLPWGTTTTVNIYDNSYGACYRPDTPDTCYTTRIPNAWGVSSTNYALSSSGIEYSIGQANQHTSTTGTAASLIGCVGFNDARSMGYFNEGGWNMIRGGYNALFAAHFAGKVANAGNGTGVTRYGSGWTTAYNTGALGGRAGSNGAYSTSLNDSIKFTTTTADSSILVGLIGVAAGSGSPFDIYVDGLLKGRLTENNIASAVASGTGYDNLHSPFVIMYTGLAYKVHTITIVHTATTTLYVDYFGTLRDAASAPPAIFLKANYNDSTGNAITGTGSRYGIAAFDKLNHIIDSVSVRWPQRYPFYIINTAIDTLSGISSDHVHPNNRGDSLETVQVLKTVPSLDPTYYREYITAGPRRLTSHFGNIDRGLAYYDEVLKLGDKLDSSNVLIQQIASSGSGSGSGVNLSSLGTGNVLIKSVTGNITSGATNSFQYDSTNNNLGVNVTGTPSARFDAGGVSTSYPGFKQGYFNIQSEDQYNNFLSYNTVISGGSYVHQTTGAGSLLSFYVDGSLGFNSIASGTVGTSATLVQQFQVGAIGQTKIGTGSATAWLHIRAGTATAGQAPLKFTSGTNLTTPEDGAIEYNGSHFYGTVGTTRYQLDQQSGGGGGSYTFSSGLTNTSGTVTNDLITGAGAGQTVNGGNAVNGTLTLSASSGSNIGITPTKDAVIIPDMANAGNKAFAFLNNGALKFYDLPATQSGTYDLLTFNSSDSTIKKIASSTFQGALTLTTTGTSGAATLTGNTINIPQYSGSGGSSQWTGTGNIYYNAGNVSIGTTDTATGQLYLYTNTDQGYAATKGLIVKDINAGGYANTIWYNNEGKLGQLMFTGSTEVIGGTPINSSQLNFISTGTHGIDFFATDGTSGDIIFSTRGSATAQYGMIGGKLGIGTLSPTSALSVGSSSQFQVNTSGAIVAAAGITSSGTIVFSGLSTGIVKNTSGTLSTAIASDFPTLNQNTTGTAANITGASNSTITTLSALLLPYSQLTGTPTIPTLASNTYTPTLTGTTNNSSPSIWQATYIRVGNVVHVSIGIDATPTASNTVTVITVTLPVTTATTSQSIVGSGSAGMNLGTHAYYGAIVSVNSGTTATITFYPTETTSDHINVQFDYVL